MASPQYTTKDLVFYTGLMGGMIITVTAMRPLGYHGLVNLICGGIAGMILGNLALKVYEGVSNADDHGNQRPMDDDSDRDSDNRF